MFTLTCFPLNHAHPHSEHELDEQRKKSRTCHTIPFLSFLTYGYNTQCLHIVTNTTCKLSLSSPVERTGSKEVKVSDGGGCFQSHKMKSILVWALLEGQIPAMCFSTFCQGRRCLTKYLCLNGPNSFMRGFSQVFVGI